MGVCFHRANLRSQIECPYSLYLTHKAWYSCGGGGGDGGGDSSGGDNDGHESDCDGHGSGDDGNSDDGDSDGGGYDCGYSQFKTTSIDRS